MSFRNFFIGATILMKILSCTFNLNQNCGKNITASASKGRNNRYHYYHCNATCGFRRRAEIVNSIFEESLKLLEMKEPVKKLIKKMFLDYYENLIKTPKEDKKRILKEIDNLNSRLSMARNKLLSEKINDEEYIEIKKNCREKIQTLEA